MSLSSDYQVAPSLTRFQQKLGDATGNWHSGDIMSGTFPGNRSDLVEKIDSIGPYALVEKVVIYRVKEITAGDGSILQSIIRTSPTASS